MSYAPTSTTDRLSTDDAKTVEEHQRLVWFVVNRLMGMQGDEDAFAAGVCGLAKAVQTFQPERGFAFSTYAVPLIKQSIQRDPLVGSDRRNRKGHHSHFMAVSLESSVWREGPGGESVYLMVNDVADPVDPIEELIDHLYGEQVLDSLLASCETEREVSMLWDRFVEGRTFTEAGENWNVTGARAKQIIDKAMRRAWGDDLWPEINPDPPPDPRVEREKRKRSLAEHNRLLEESRQQFERDAEERRLAFVRESRAREEGRRKDQSSAVGRLRAISLAGVASRGMGPEGIRAFMETHGIDITQALPWPPLADGFYSFARIDSSGEKVRDVRSNGVHGTVAVLPGRRGRIKSGIPDGHEWALDIEWADWQSAAAMILYLNQAPGFA